MRQRLRCLAGDESRGSFANAVTAAILSSYDSSSERIVAFNCFRLVRVLTDQLGALCFARDH